MRKLVVEEWISLDGFVSDRNGKLDFFAPLVRDTYAAGDSKFLEAVDCILFGRKTYEQFASVWPSRPVSDELLARKMNTSQKIVFSSTLKEAPWGSWNPVTIERGDPVPHILALKSGTGKTIVVWAGISLAQQLGQSGLVDEYHLFVCPVLLGGGRRLFSDGTNEASLSLVNAKGYKNGVVFLNYRSQDKISSI